MKAFQMLPLLMGLSALALGTFAPAVPADSVHIEGVLFKQGPGGAWRVSTRLRHGDTGWKHYADAWRVVDAEGVVLGERLLAHPHVSEQPFTRSQSGIKIPSALSEVFVEAHDKVHGWSADRLRVDLSQASGYRFSVKR